MYYNFILQKLIGIGREFYVIIVQIHLQLFTCNNNNDNTNNNINNKIILIWEINKIFHKYN